MTWVKDGSLRSIIPAKPLEKGRSSASIRLFEISFWTGFPMSFWTPDGPISACPLDRRALLAGSAVLALAGWVSRAVAATPQPVAENDPRIATETVPVPGKDGLSGYLARPKAAGKRPGLLYLHDERGLSARAKDIARRLAAEGFLVLAIDYLSPTGGTPADAKQAALALSRMARDEALARGHAGLEFLQRHAGSTGKVGAFGIGWGATLANEMAVQEPTLNGAVTYYGIQPSFHLREEYAVMKSPLMQHYAGRDIETNVGIDPFEVELKESKKSAAIFIYPAVERGFDDDGNPATYNKEAATLAWERSIAFLKKSTG